MANLTIVDMWKFIKHKTKEAEHKLLVFGLLAIIGHALFYFFNLTSPNSVYENFWLRSIAVLVSILLAVHKFWPQSWQKIKPIYWYCSVTYLLPFFFTFMLLKNHGAVEWQMNFLITLTLLILLLDWVSVTVVSLCGIGIAILFYYVTDSNPTLPNNYVALINTTISLLVYCVLFSHKTEAIQTERRIRLELTEEENIKLEHKVQERTAELEVALAAKTDFLNKMSHEIRTPVQGVTAISEGLVHSWKKFDDTKKFALAEQIASNAKRLLTLISNLLDLARNSGGKMFLDLTKTDLNNLTSEMIEECKSLYTLNKKINFKFKKDSEALINVDQEKISQVLRNLFVNAIKFSPTNSTILAKIKTSKIANETGQKIEAIHFMLEDQGVGIPPSELSSIFLPFTQSTKTNIKSGGVGLGLAICKDIVSIHHGQIWAENLPNGGTRFNVLLPVNQHTPEQLPNYSDRAVINTLSVPVKPATVLMIDDEDACLISMELLLNDSEHKLVTHNNSREGLAYLKKHKNKIDIILLDLMMPGIDGMNVIEKIKNDPKTSNIPIIIQSGIADEAEINQAYQFGIQAYIKKPYDRATVLNEINRILSRKQN